MGPLLVPDFQRHVPRQLKRPQCKVKRQRPHAAGRGHQRLRPDLFPGEAERHHLGGMGLQQLHEAARGGPREILRAEGGHDAPREQAAGVEEALQLCAVEDEAVEIGVGIEADDVGGRAQDQRPVRVGADVNSGEAAPVMDGIDDFSQAGGDVFPGDADELGGSEAGQGGLVE